MLTDIQKGNIKSILEKKYDLIVHSIRDEKSNAHAKIVCEYNTSKVTLSCVHDRKNNKYKIFVDMRTYAFVSPFMKILEEHKGYQALVSMEAMISYPMFSLTHYVTDFVLMESNFLSKRVSRPSFKVMTNFQFSQNNQSSLASIVAGVTTFSVTQTIFNDKFSLHMYQRPLSRPVNHIDVNIEFKNKNDNMKMIQDVIITNYIKYMNFIKPFKFEYDDINQIMTLDSVEAAYRINANFAIKDMVHI